MKATLNFRRKLRKGGELRLKIELDLRWLIVAVLLLGG